MPRRTITAAQHSVQPHMLEVNTPLCCGWCEQVNDLKKWHPAQHVVTESLTGAIVTQTIVCHGPSHPKLPQPSPGKHAGVAEFVFQGAVAAHPSTLAPFFPACHSLSSLAHVFVTCGMRGGPHTGLAYLHATSLNCCWLCRPPGALQN